MPDNTRRLCSPIVGAGVRATPGVLENRQGRLGYGSGGIFRRLPKRGDHETTTFPELAAEGKLFGYRSRAYWRTVDTFKDLTEAAAEVREMAPA